jgi:ATP-grasp domain
MHAAYVAPFFLPATLRFIEAATRVPDVALSVVSQDPESALPDAIRSRLAGHWRVDDALSPAALVGAVRALSSRAPVRRLIASLEQAQEPLAAARAELGLPGLSLDAARNFRDKSRMKEVLDAAQLPCAGHRLVADQASARAAARELGFPLVAKPPAGAGAAQTYRLDDERMLAAYLARHPPAPGRPALFEEFLSGEEHSFDAALIGGRLVWYSVSRYRPAPLTVIENPWIQWCVLLPRELEPFADVAQTGVRALRTLGLETGLAHMEWFRRPDGSIAISEVAARPPGAQFMTLISYAHDQDFYQAWARLMLTETFAAAPRAYAAGAAYIRGTGTGRIRAVYGLDEAARELGKLVVEAELPRPGQTQGAGYEGAGHVIVRAPETATVDAALARLVRLIRVELA